jgi:hypothetical protein
MGYTWIMDIDGIYVSRYVQICIVFDFMYTWIYIYTYIHTYIHPSDSKWVFPGLTDGGLPHSLPLLSQT